MALVLQHIVFEQAKTSNGFQWYASSIMPYGAFQTALSYYQPIDTTIISEYIWCIEKVLLF